MISDGYSQAQVDFFGADGPVLPLSIGDLVDAYASRAAPPPTTEAVGDPGEEMETRPLDVNSLYDGGAIYNPDDSSFAGFATGFSSSGGQDPMTHLPGVTITGKRLMLEPEITMILRYLTPDGSDDGATSIGELNLNYDSAPHIYVVTDQVSNNPADAALAWEALKQYAAPGQSGPAYSGKVVSVPALGNVVQQVREGSMTVVNSTMEGHLLYPGFVERSVIVEGGRIYIQTRGMGTGNFSGQNVVNSPALWGAQDLAISLYIATHRP